MKVFTIVEIDKEHIIAGLASSGILIIGGKLLWDSGWRFDLMGKIKYVLIGFGINI